MDNEIVIAGVGMVPFRKPGQSDPYDVMGAGAARLALQDAGITYGLIEQAYAGYVYGDSCSGQTALYHLDINGIPIFNVNNNCASGSSAFALASQAVESNAVDCALALGFEEMPPGAVDVVFPAKTSPLARHEEAIARRMDLTNEELRTHLRHTSDDPSGLGFDLETGYGRVNLVGNQFTRVVAPLAGFLQADFGICP